MQYEETINIINKFIENRKKLQEEYKQKTATFPISDIYQMEIITLERLKTQIQEKRREDMIQRKYAEIDTETLQMWIDEYKDIVNNFKTEYSKIEERIINLESAVEQLDNQTSDLITICEDLGEIITNMYDKNKI